MRSVGLFLGVVLTLAGATVNAGGSGTSITSEALGRISIIDLVSDQTTVCRKEKDQSLCFNYFSDDGVIKRLDDDGSRKQGVWFIDDKTRLCILWKGKIKPLCFKVYEQEDGSYNLLKKGKHITTILSTEAGNTKNQ